MNGNYLIPANTKRGQLILGLFYPIDLIILGTGVFITILLMALLPIDQVWFAVAAVTPALIAGFLVIPVAYYHNIRQMVAEAIKYLISRKRYLWKGWCFLDESEYTESKSRFEQKG